MLAIAIDGACRRNGREDCVSAGGAFIMQLDENLQIVDTTIVSNYEIGSTNQRGELIALLTAIDYVHDSGKQAQIVTDSEYLFNSVTKGWCESWINKGWLTAIGEPVKNKDIWLEIHHALQRCAQDHCEVNLYHIKGHAISFGKVTAQKLLSTDPTGRTLFDAVCDKIALKGYKEGIVDNVSELSIKNNGFVLDESTLNRFVASNTVADAAATMCVIAADALIRK